MDYLTGKTEKDTLDISELLTGEYEGKEVSLNGAIHKIRDMGDVAFIILRKREGLVQTVYEKGAVDTPLKDLCEEAAVEVRGDVAKEDRAPNGFEVRLRGIRILSRPSETMPIAVNKWKMNTSLETKLAVVAQCEGAGEVPDSGGHCAGLPRFSPREGIYGDSHAEDWGQRRRGRRQPVPAGIFPQTRCAGAEPPVL